LAYTGNKIAWCDYDDVGPDAFRYLRDNPSTSSIFNVPFFSWCKSLHDTYGAVFILPCFYSVASPAFNLSEVPSTFKAEFEANASWLKFTFHSYSTSTTYPDADAIGPTWTNKDYYAAGTGRNQYDDFVLMQNQMQRIAGSAWNPSLIVAHVIHGRQAQMTQIEQHVGHPVLWVAFPPSVQSLWDFNYYFDSTANPEFKTGLNANGYYHDTTNDRVFIASSAYPDSGMNEDDEAAESFAAQLSAVIPTVYRNTFLCLSHEYLYANGGFQQYFTDFCTWINAQGTYTWQTPDDTFIRTAYSLPASTVTFLPVATLSLGTPTGLTVPVTLAGNAVSTAYILSESGTDPLASDERWGAAPTSYEFASGGSKTLYAWAKDASGNVSAASSAAVTVSATSSFTIADAYSASHSDQITLTLTHGVFTISDAYSASSADNLALSLQAASWPIRNGASTRTLKTASGTPLTLRRNVAGTWQ
jgi:hypothetical protein